MFEKVNPWHPDKCADRIAGAIVDLCYQRSGGLEKSNPRVAVEVLIGHGIANVIVETNVPKKFLTLDDMADIVTRICPEIEPEFVRRMLVPQDTHLARNQERGLRCGDNGIFKGAPVTAEQRLLTDFVRWMANIYKSDGKYLMCPARKDIADSEVASLIPDALRLVCCQSNATKEEIITSFCDFCREKDVKIDVFIPVWNGYTLIPIVNPLGLWTGGTDVDSGATNRKLGSDMGDAVTGGGLHGKDLSKADVSVNIACHLRAQERSQFVEACCSIGSEEITFYYEDGSLEHVPFTDVVDEARQYILREHGSFERFAEWGLIC